MEIRPADPDTSRHPISRDDQRTGDKFTSSAGDQPEGRKFGKTEKSPHKKTAHHTTGKTRSVRAVFDFIVDSR